ncbi:hypothetical protein AH06_132 [Erwinia phage AH06]|nr:hypothetical protein AH06_132 [Erwinia phage AH06]
MESSEQHKSTIDNSTSYSQELAELIEDFVAVRFTDMDDSVLASLYADLPDVHYLKGVVKGLRRNLMRQAQQINVEEAYPQTWTVAEVSVAQLASEIIQEENPDMPADEVAQTVAEIVTASAEEPDDDEVDNSEALRFRQTAVPSLSELTRGTDKGWPTELTKKDVQQMTVSKSDLRQMVVTKEDLERVGMVGNTPRFMSRAERFGTTQVALSNLLSEAKPGSVFSADNITASKNQSLQLVKSPESFGGYRPAKMLLEATDPQYYQYMWPTLFEAIDALARDNTIPASNMRRLDDESILERLGEGAAAAARTIISIGNRDLLIKENVTYFMSQVEILGVDVKLYLGEKLYQGSSWTGRWKDASLQTRKGKFVFGKVEADVVWRTN